MVVELGSVSYFIEGFDIFVVFEVFWLFLEVFWLLFAVFTVFWLFSSCFWGFPSFSVLKTRIFNACSAILVDFLFLWRRFAGLYLNFLSITFFRFSKVLDLTFLIFLSSSRLE